LRKEGRKVVKKGRKEGGKGSEGRKEGFAPSKELDDGRQNQTGDLHRAHRVQYLVTTVFIKKRLVH
jgi:hypothetical protein